MFPIHCGVSTTRSSAITKTTVLLTLDQYVNDVEQEVMSITPTIVQNQQNVSVVVDIIYQDPVNVKFGKTKIKS